MKINRMTSYAIRIVGRLSQAGGKILTSKEIAEIEKISLGVLMKLMKKLREADIVYSRQGRGRAIGGFGLKADISEITLYDIISTVEDEITLYPIQEEDFYTDQYKEIYDEMIRIHEVYVEELKQYSLLEILSQEEEILIS